MRAGAGGVAQRCCVAVVAHPCAHMRELQGCLMEMRGCTVCVVSCLPSRRECSDELRLGVCCLLWLAPERPATHFQISLSNPHNRGVVKLA